MSRRRPPVFNEKIEPREKAKVARERTLQFFKQHKVVADQERDAREEELAQKRDRFKVLDVVRAVDAAKRLKFIDLEEEAPRTVRSLNRPMQTLIGFFLSVLRERSSIACLQWPRGSRDVSALHPLAMLAMICSPEDRTDGGYNWCRGIPDFRTIYYPWRGSATGAYQRRILVDRDELVKRNALHLTRRQVGQPEFSDQLGMLHLTIGHLSTLKRRDDTKPHLAHPTLGELYPAFGASGGPDAVRPFGKALCELFGRVDYGAGLKKLHDNRSSLSRPDNAPFACFGICPRANIKNTLQLQPLVSRPADVCLLDLGPPGLSRLGAGWEKLVGEFLELLVRFQPETPVLAVTQDTYVHRRVGQLLINAGLARRDSRDHPSSRIITRSTEDYFSPDPEFGKVSPVEFHFHSTTGQGVIALQVMRDAAQAVSDPAMAGNIRNAMGSVRRAMNLPCGLGRAHELLSDSDAGAEAFLERRSAGTILALIKKQIEETADSSTRQKLTQAEAEINKAFDEFEIDTPIGSLLKEVAGSISGKSSQSVFAFSSDYDLILGQDRICQKDEQGERMRRRIDTGFVRLTTLKKLDNELADIESGRSRNSWKRLIVVAPPSDALAVLLGRRWLPEEMIILADREFVERLGWTYASLAVHPDLAGVDKIGGRLANAAAAAKKEAAGRDVGPVNLESAASDPLLLPDDAVIDLTADDDDDEHDVIEFGLDSGHMMRIRPGGLVIRYDRVADVNPFDRTVAREIRENDTIVVPDRIFVQQARAVLPVRVLAQTRVELYHSLVEAALPRIPGTTRSEKARYILRRLRAAGTREVVEATVLNWLNVAEHVRLPPDKRRPNAPQHLKEFLVFMDAIGVPSGLAKSIWQEGIEPFRISRRRAGVQTAQAFVSVLVDPHGGTAAMSPEIKEGIARLRRRAMEHLDRVVSVDHLNRHGGLYP